MGKDVGSDPTRVDGNPDQPSTKSCKPRGRGGRPANQHVGYALDVRSWDHFYSWHAERRTRHEEPGYRYLEAVTFDGVFIRPEGMAHRQGRVTLSGHAGMRQEEFKGTKPVIGSIDLRQDRLEAYVFVPEEHMPQLVAVAASGRVRFVLLGGTGLKRRHGTAESVSVRTEIHPEDI